VAPPRLFYRGAVLDGETVEADGRRFVACEHRHCTLVYSGGDGFEFRQPHLTNCRWRLEGAAWRTVQFLQGLRHVFGLGEVVRQFIDLINAPPG
jgi:hypothetical protein